MEADPDGGRTWAAVPATPPPPSAGLNALWRLGLDRDELVGLGAELGSDVPFFFAAPRRLVYRARREGRSRSPLAGRSISCWFLRRWACPPRRCFGTSSPRRRSRGVRRRTVRRAAEAGDVEELGRRLHNRLQAAAERLRPEVAEWRERLAALGPAGQLDDRQRQHGFRPLPLAGGSPYASHAVWTPLGMKAPGRESISCGVAFECATEKRRTTVVITEVRIKLMDDNNENERLQAFCSVTFDDAFVVRDLKIIEGTKGSFVAMPSRKLTDRCPGCGCKNHLRARFCNPCGGKLDEDRATRDADGRVKLHADIAHPINSACREVIQSAVLKALPRGEGTLQAAGLRLHLRRFRLRLRAATTGAAAMARSSARWARPRAATARTVRTAPRGTHTAPQATTAAARQEKRPTASARAFCKRWLNADPKHGRGRCACPCFGSFSRLLSFQISSGGARGRSRVRQNAGGPR